MNRNWVIRGRVDAARITKLVLSPAFQIDTTVFAATLAGISISRDAGRTWEAPGREVPGPFIFDLALSPHYESDQTVYATTPAGLFRSTEGGRRWEMPILAELAGLVAVAPDGAVYLVADGDTSVWRGSGTEQQFELAGRLPQAPESLVVDAANGDLWALTAELLLRSHDGGGSWEYVSLPIAADCQALVTLGRGSVALGTDQSGVLIYRPRTGWEVPKQTMSLNVCGLGASPDGSVVVAATTEGVAVSTDGGLTWATPKEPMPVTSVAFAEGGIIIFAGTVRGGCQRSTDGGRSWQETGVMAGTLIASLKSGYSG